MIDGTVDRWYVPMERTIDWRKETVRKIHTAVLYLDDALESIRHDKSIAYTHGDVNHFDRISNCRNMLKDLEKELGG